MSIVRIAVRIAAVQAIRGRTFVGANVLDSEIGALQVDGPGQLRTEEDAPFIAVYTDAANSKGAVSGIRDLHSNGVTDILLEAGITAAMTETDDATDETKLLGWGIPMTDQGFEFHLDMISRQIADVLNDPDNEWAEIFRSFLLGIKSVERSRISSAGGETRLAGHQIKITANLIAEPVKGAELSEKAPLSRFFAKAATIDDPGIAAQVTFMLAQLSGDDAQWKAAVRRFGLTRDEADAMLITPADGASDDGLITQIAAAPTIVQGAPT